MQLALSPMTYEPDRRVHAKVLRRLTQWRITKPLHRDPDVPIVTFTFDDFPKSAVFNGASIIESVGARATYYACSGLMNRETAAGLQYDAQDLRDLAHRGHEIGAHTHHHIDCARTPHDAVLDDIERNLVELEKLNHTDIVPQFAYPYGETTPRLKTALASKFRASRGILPGVNGLGSDLMQLRSMELTPAKSTIKRALNAIESAKYTPKWVIIFTHDVRENPSDFGTTPDELRRVVEYTANAGIDIMTMTEALNAIGGAANDA